MTIRLKAKTFATLVLSVLFAAVFYVGWLAMFLPSFKMGYENLRLLGWLSAPVITSFGFAIGLWLAYRLFSHERARFFRLWILTFVGCSLGALAVYWYGPMLIVFGMFAGGTAVVAWREFLRKKQVAQ